MAHTVEVLEGFVWIDGKPMTPLDAENLAQEVLRALSTLRPPATVRAQARYN